MCLQVRPATFVKEEIVKQECVNHYKKELVDVNRHPPSVYYVKYSKEGLFVKQDLEYIAENATRHFGKDFKKMSDADRKSYLDKLRAQQELERIKEKLNLND